MIPTGGTRRGRLALSVAAIACLAIATTSLAACAAKITDIYVFQGGTDAQLPSGGLISDPKGKLYGTTTAGGAYGYGTVYRLDPPAAGQTQWTDEVLHSFSGPDGFFPAGTLTMDSSGNLYGTATGGGPSDPSKGYGTVFKLANTPGWPLTVLHDFGNGSSGGYPADGVIFGPEGLLYGVTGDFGTKTAAEAGTLFSVSPAGDSVEFAVLHEFGKPGVGQNGDGFIPTGLRAVDGATLIGSCLESYGPISGGDIYEQKIVSNGKDPYGIAYYFNKPPDVRGPGMPPLPGLGAYKGTYFGTALSGGAYSDGGIYSIAPAVSGGADENVIYSFGSQPDDTMGSPAATLIQTESSGILEGTSNAGGAYGQGTLFELDPPAGTSGSWTEKLLVNFDSKEPSVGGGPQGTLLRVGPNIYGAVENTTTGYGAIYEVMP